MAFAMEFGTGFEMGRVVVDGNLMTTTGTVTPTGTSHTGAYALRLYGNTPGAYVRVRRPSPAAEIYVSSWIRWWDKSTGSIPEIRITIAGSVVAYLRGRHSGGSGGPRIWDAYVDGSLVASGAIAVAHDTWHHVQLHFVASDSGILETIIDGVPDISYSGDTQPGASDQIDGVFWAHNGYSQPILYVDDIAFGTGGWPGDLRFEAVQVSGDVAGACDWTPEPAGDHYAAVDEIPASSADYIYAREDLSERLATPGTWDDTDGLGNVVKDPFAVIVWASARKEDGNQDDQLALVQSDGINEVAQAGASLLTSYEDRWFIRELAPDDGEWTTAKVNDLVIGLDANVEEVE